MRRTLISITLLTVAFTLWTPALNALELWGDELYTQVVTAKPLAEMLHIVLIDAVHPPLYYLLIHAWQKMAGSSAFSLRYPSVLAMLLGLAALARLGREIKGARMGRLALLLGTFNPFLFWYAQEVRMYALLFTLTAMAMLLFSLALKGQRWTWFAQAIVAALLINTHYFGFFALLPPLTFLMAEKRWRRKLPAWIAAHTASALTFLPWLQAWFNRYPKHVSTAWISALYPVGFLLTLRTFFLSGTELWFWPAILGSIGIAMAFGAAFLRRDPHRWRPWLALTWGLPWALIALISWTILPIYVDRYFMIIVPGLCLWLAWGIDNLSPIPARLALVGLLAGMASGALGIAILPTWQRPQWHQAIALIQETAQPDDILLTNSPTAEVARLAYAADLVPFTRLVARTEKLPEAPAPEPRCDQGVVCWVVWERFFILTHFPPSIDVPTTLAQQLASENTTAAWLLEHRSQCTAYSFTHIEVWRCGD